MGSRSQEERCIHYSRTLPLEDENEARHQGRREDHVWQRDQGEGKASQDHCEGLPSVRFEEADLVCCTAFFPDAFPTACVSVGIPWACLGRMFLNFANCTSDGKVPCAQYYR